MSADLAQPNKLKKIALTGGPGVGKSSIIRCLKDQGYSTREEVFTYLFAQAQKQGHFNEQYLYSQELIHRLTVEQLELENRNVGEKVIFLDRSRIDIWGYARNMGISPIPEDQALLEKGDYEFIFIIEPMPKEFYDQNSIRRQSYVESLNHHELNLKNSLDYLKVQGKSPNKYLIKVPFTLHEVQLSPLQRSQFILKHLKLTE